MIKKVLCVVAFPFKCLNRVILVVVLAVLATLFVLFVGAPFVLKSKIKHTRASQRPLVLWSHPGR